MPRHAPPPNATLPVAPAFPLRPYRPLVLALAMAVTAAACERADDDRVAPDGAAPRSSAADGSSRAAQSAAATTPTPSTANTGTGTGTVTDAAITMRYTCEQGHAVAIAGDEAWVTLADGRRVAIARVEGSAPPRFAGEALSFSVNATGAVLGQDEVGGFDCKAD